MTVPLRDRLARRLYREYAARFCSVVVGWKNLYPEHRDHWREIADALLASEEWQAREAVVKAVCWLAWVSSGQQTQGGQHVLAERDAWEGLRVALARLDAVRGEETTS